MYALLYKCVYVCDPVRLRLRHLYQVEFCSFIVRYPTAGASVYCGHISSCFSFSMHTVSVGQLDARPTGDQEVAGSTPAEAGNILSWRLIMKYFYSHSLPSADSRRAIVSFW